MISKGQGQKIVQLLKSDPVAVNYSSQLKFWVKKHGFQLTSYSPLGLKDVLDLPAENQVGGTFNVKRSSVAPPYLCPGFLHNFKNAQKWLFRNF